MAVLRVYAKDGTDLTAGAPITSPVVLGPIEYIGMGRYLTCNTDNVQELELIGTTLTHIRTPYRFVNAGEEGVGLACQRHAFADDCPFSTGGMLFISMQDVVSAAATFTVRVYDMLATRLMHTQSIGPITPGPICTNGSWFYLGFTLAGTPRLAVYDVSGLTFSLTAIWTAPTFIEDMTFDGHHLWSIEGNNAIRREAIGEDLPDIVGGFALAGATHAGICTDGQNLIVYSDT